MDKNLIISGSDADGFYIEIVTKTLCIGIKELGIITQFYPVKIKIMISDTNMGNFEAFQNDTSIVSWLEETFNGAIVLHEDDELVDVVESLDDFEIDLIKSKDVSFRYVGDMLCKIIKSEFSHLSDTFNVSTVEFNFVN